MHNGVPLPVVHDPQVSAAMEQLQVHSERQHVCLEALPASLPGIPASLVGFYAEDVTHGSLTFSMLVSSWLSRKRVY